MKHFLLTCCIFMGLFSQAQTTTLPPITVPGFSLTEPVTPPGGIAPITIQNVGSQTSVINIQNPIPGQADIYNYEDSMKAYLRSAGHFDENIPHHLNDTIEVLIRIIHTIKNPMHDNSLHIFSEWSQVPGAGNAPADQVDSVYRRKFSPVLFATMYIAQCGDLAGAVKKLCLLSGLWTRDQLFGVSLGSSLYGDEHSCAGVIVSGDTIFVDGDVNERGWMFRNLAKYTGWASPQDLFENPLLITEGQAYFWPNGFGGFDSLCPWVIDNYRARFAHGFTMFPENDFAGQTWYKFDGNIYLSPGAILTIYPQILQDKYMMNMSNPMVQASWDSLNSWYPIYTTTGDSAVKAAIVDSIKSVAGRMIPYLTNDSAVNVLINRNFKKVDGNDLVPMDTYSNQVPTYTITIPPTNHDLILGQHVGACNVVTRVKTSKPLKLWTSTISDSIDYLPNLWTSIGSAYATKEQVNPMNNGIVYSGTTAVFTVAYNPFLQNPSKGFTIGQGSAPDTLVINGVLRIDTGTATAVGDIKQDNAFSIFPNPTSGEIQISGSEVNEVRPVDVYDTSGRKIVSYNLQYKNQTFDISNLQGGIYFVKIGNQTKRIVLQRQ